jgi:glutathione reductase (NADPH)
MWYAAHHAHGFHHVADYGFDVEVKGHDWAGLKERRDAYIKRLNGIYENNLDKRGVTYLSGHARFVDAHTVDIDGQKVEADRIYPAPNLALRRMNFSNSTPDRNAS